jgi:hypothetical protein
MGASAFSSLRIRARVKTKIEARRKIKGSKKKGPLLMKKRPKSREETPKEGSSNARSATAPQQYAAATHKVQELLSRFPCKTHMAQLLTLKPRFSFFDKEFQ